ncbi:twin-arginine translocation signal domain-containing protein [Roseobacter sp. CCS2]|uniref:twin-arginine translocation signal domain-containing protein n=1 Tax=Roseobacter sp. CCS2 TaxID=391593 RepID=UPI0000F40155|nr:twin-arginine translocation signal domain-containing protein [Roseobacter sp. CCS2]EBA13954.1 hypothetical protein RCCS2_08694 [Roseobacter sp. CCS2]
MTHQAKQKRRENRRDFLKLSVTAAPLAAAVVVTGADPAQASAPDLSDDTMQDTAQTRAYYDAARF